MAKAMVLKFDEIGYWSELKLEIIREYAAAYSRILKARAGLSHVYVDAFAGAGKHKKKGTGEFIEGSPLVALGVRPNFDEYHFIDLESEKVDFLRNQVGDRPNTYFHVGDANTVLLNEVFPGIRYEEYRRGLCLLDPYGLHLDWRIMRAAGRMKSIDMFLNFPVADMNRNVFWHNPEGVDPSDIARMNRFWGDTTWRDSAYHVVPTLFEDLEFVERTDNWTIAQAFRERLKSVGGFEHVPDPLPMRNNQGAIVYYLFFASQKAVADKIVTDIFRKYANKGAAIG
jgi:three-Cys-motif partner protein